MKSIYRCAELQDARQNPSHPCHKIASVQRYGICNTYQVPEPWRGDISRACLLFVSSNPSIDPTDDSPWATDSDTNIENYYHRGFDLNVFPKIEHPASGGLTSVAFWSAILNRASELFDVNKERLIPGKHFAITEIVHCKSRSEFGVKEALAKCKEAHLANVLGKSRALVICSLGAHARAALNGMNLRTAAGAPILINLPHPNARKERTVEKSVDEHLLQQVRRALRGGCGHNDPDETPA